MKKSGGKSGELIRQNHGGAIRRGSKPGNKPGSGRPPSAVRDAARLAFADRLHVLTDIADDQEAKPIDRIRAIDLLGKYGGIEKLALIVEEQPEEEVTPELIAEYWQRLNRIRTIEQFEKLLVAAAQKQIADRIA